MNDFLAIYFSSGFGSGAPSVEDILEVLHELLEVVPDSFQDA